MKLLVLAFLASAAVNQSKAQTIEEELKVFEKLARTYCSVKSATDVERCTQAQLMAGTILGMRKAEDRRITDDLLKRCFVQVGEAQTGGANFIEVLKCVDD